MVPFWLRWSVKKPVAGGKAALARARSKAACRPQSLREAPWSAERQFRFLRDPAASCRTESPLCGDQYAYVANYQGFTTLFMVHHFPVDKTSL
jgi:hypothetical protein